MEEIDRLLDAARQGVGDSIDIARTAIKDIAQRRQEQRQREQIITAKQDNAELPIVQRATAILKDATETLVQMKRSKRRDQS